MTTAIALPCAWHMDEAAWARFDAAFDAALDGVPLAELVADAFEARCGAAWERARLALESEAESGPDGDAAADARIRQAELTKPAGSLGRLEDPHHEKHVLSRRHALLPRRQLSRAERWP